MTDDPPSLLGENVYEFSSKHDSDATLNKRAMLNNTIRCNICFKHIRQVNYQQHLKNHAQQNGNKYKCPHCDASFNRSYTLQQHLPIHSAEPQFKCDLCGAKFRQKPSLYNHMKRFHNKQKSDAKSFMSSTYNQATSQYSSHQIIKHEAFEPSAAMMHRVQQQQQHMEPARPELIDTSHTISEQPLINTTSAPTIMSVPTSAPGSIRPPLNVAGNAMRPKMTTMQSTEASLSAHPLPVLSSTDRKNSDS